MKKSAQGACKGARPFWAEFYSLSEDCGITFAATGIQLFRGILRIELPVTKGLDPDDRWLDVYLTDGEYLVDGRSWSDFGCSPTPWKAFRRLTVRRAQIAITCAWDTPKTACKEEHEGRTQAKDLQGKQQPEEWKAI